MTEEKDGGGSQQKIKGEKSFTRTEERGGEVMKSLTDGRKPRPTFSNTS